MNVNRQIWFPWQQKTGENTQTSYAKPTHSTFFSYPVHKLDAEGIKCFMLSQCKVSKWTEALGR